MNIRELAIRATHVESFGAQVVDGIRDWLEEHRDRLTRQAFPRLYRSVRPYTMCGYQRLRGLYHAVCAITNNRIPGAVVECGVAHGGSVLLILLTLRALGESRRVWGFDTFRGLPPPSVADPDYTIARFYTGSFQWSLEEVEAVLQRFGVAGQCRLVQGMFQRTLPMLDEPRIAFLHVDGDWYDSVRACLRHLYDRVSPGGIIQFDDYGHWQGARKAVEEFVQQRGITVPLRRLDYSGRQLIKP